MFRPRFSVHGFVVPIMKTVGQVVSRMLADAATNSPDQDCQFFTQSGPVDGVRLQNMNFRKRLPSRRPPVLREV
jgi:hypothetical protein